MRSRHFLAINLIIKFFFFFNDTATTEIYTLSLHDALPISSLTVPVLTYSIQTFAVASLGNSKSLDRKSTRLNSSHLGISYAVFCLKKKKKKQQLKSNTDISYPYGITRYRVIIYAQVKLASR